MNKKKIIKIAVLWLIAIALVAMPFLVACAKPAPAPKPTPAPTPAPAPKPPPAPSPTPAPKPAPTPAPAAKPAPAEKLPDYFVFAASGKGKVYDLMAYYSEMITKYTSMKGSIEMTPGPTPSLEMVAAGTSQGTAYSPPGMILAAQQKKLRIFTLFCGGGLEASTVMGLFTKPGAGIKSVKDIKGKKVYAEKPAIAWMKPSLEALLKVNGMTASDFTYLKFENAEDCFKALKEGRVDAFFYLAGSGTVDMAQSTGLFVVPFTPQEQQALEDIGLGWVKVVWTAGDFGNPNDTPTAMAPIPFLSSNKLSDHAAYTVTKVMFDHLKEFQSSQKAAEGFTRENALLTFAFPYHSGAIKYFKEIGLWKTEHDTKQQKALETWKKTLGS